MTGGIGSGKSAVLEIMARRGLAVIRSDDVAHTVILPGTRAHRQIVEHFGDGILTADGTIDRDRLAEVVFTDPDELAILNGIVHPPVIEHLRHCFEEIAASGECVTMAVEIPLLVEAGMVDTVDQVILVTAPRDVRIERMVGHGWSEKRVRAVIEAQAADAEKAKVADVVIVNAGDLVELDARVSEALAEIVGGACVE